MTYEELVEVAQRHHTSPDGSEWQTSPEVAATLAVADRLDRLGDTLHEIGFLIQGIEAKK